MSEDLLVAWFIFFYYLSLVFASSLDDVVVLAFIILVELDYIFD